MMRPKARPAGMMKKKKAATSAPMTSMRPKARPNTMVTPEEAGAIERGNRAAKRRADEMPMMKAGGMMKKGYKAGGKLKQPDGDNVGLKKLPESVRNNMGYMAKGGMAKKGYAKGGMMKKGYKKGGKVRGCGMASKGVRAAKMVTMKGA